MLFMGQQEKSKSEICGKLARNKTFESWSRVLEDSGRLGHEWTMHCNAIGRGTGGILILQLISFSLPISSSFSGINHLQSGHSGIRASGHLGIYASGHLGVMRFQKIFGLYFLKPYKVEKWSGRVGLVVLCGWWVSGSVDSGCHEVSEIVLPGFGIF